MLRKIFGRKAVPIKAVYEQDIAAYLQSLGVLERLEKGEIKCMNCNQVITLENVDAIIPKKGQIKFLCWSKECQVQEI